MIDYPASALVVAHTGHTRALPYATRVRLMYDTADQLAVWFRFADDIIWCVSRDLLADALTRAVGEGDVRIRPIRDPRGGHPQVEVTLESPPYPIVPEPGRMVFLLPRSAVVKFLHDTYREVKRGHEVVDVDAALAHFGVGAEG